MIDFPYRALGRGVSPGQEFPNPFTTARSPEEHHAMHREYQRAMRETAEEEGIVWLDTESELRRS